MKKQMTMIAVGGLFVILAGISSILNLSGQKNAEAFEPWPVDSLIGNKAPDFSLEDLSGNKVSISSFSGKPVLLNFWATWCPYCRKERAHLRKLYENYSGEDLVIVSISIDRSLKSLKKFMKDEPVRFVILHDGEGSVSSLYHVAGLPTSFLIGRSGIVKRKFTGLREWSTPESRKIIDAFLHE